MEIIYSLSKYQQLLHKGQNYFPREGTLQDIPAQRPASGGPAVTGCSYTFTAAFSDFPEDVHLRSGQVEAIRVHHLVPGRHEIIHELLLRIVLRVDFGQRPQLRV